MGDPGAPDDMGIPHDDEESIPEKVAEADESIIEDAVGNDEPEELTDAEVNFKLVKGEMENLTPRQLGRLAEDIGDILRDHEGAAPEMRAIGDLIAESGYRIVAVDGGRKDYQDEQ